MADDRPEDTELSPDLVRAKRAPPTIELEATEVSDKPAAETDGERSAEPTTEPAEHLADDTREGETANQDSDTVQGTPTGEIPPGPAPRGRLAVAVLISAISGAATAALVLAIAWQLQPPAEIAAPAPEAPQVDHAALDRLVARVASLESKTAAPAGPTPATDSAVPSRIDALEISLASLRAELAAARNRSEKLNAAVDELRAATRDGSPPPDLSTIEQRLSQLERATSAQIAAAAQQTAKPADDTALRRVVAATVLDVSVRHGEPFAAALDAAKALAPDPGSLKPLEPFAKQGVPGPAAFSRDLLALLPKPAAAPETTTATGTGIVDRLQAGAARLVRIQRTDTTDTSDRSAAILRAAAAAQRNDFATARRELDALPGAERALVQGGIERLDARDAALAASRQFATDAMAALSKPAP